MELNQGSPAMRILVIEDNPGDVGLIELALDAADVTYVLTTIDDGARAMDFFRQTASEADGSMPDLVILDLNLPKYGGLEILEMVRANRSFAGLPIVVLSSTSSPRELSIIEAYADVCFLTKPSDLDQYLSIGFRIKEFFSEIKRRQNLS